MNRLDRIFRSFSFLAMTGLIFLMGAFTVLAEIWPYHLLSDGFRGGLAALEQSAVGGDPLKTHLWQRAVPGPSGVTTPAKRSSGALTLFTSGDEASAHLINDAGEVVHKWHKPYSQVWTPDAAVDDPRPDRMIFFRRAEVRPDGDLLAIYETANDTPWGYGLVRLGPDSSVQWRFLANAHHDFSVRDDGRVAVVTNRISRDMPEWTQRLRNPFLRDGIALLDADGNPTKRLDVFQIWLDSPYANPYGNPVDLLIGDDPLHLNSVQWLDADQAEALGRGSAGDLLVSFRQISTIALINPDTEAVVWATRGPWLAQHDPTVLPDGDILLFDNLGGHQAGNRSRAMAFDPDTHAVTWTYSGSQDNPLMSNIRSSARRLANGNTLITESRGARLIEVSPAGEIVWAYRYPVRAGNDPEMAPAVAGGMRFHRSWFTPAFQQTLPNEVQP